MEPVKAPPNDVTSYDRDDRKHCRNLKILLHGDMDIEYGKQVMLAENAYHIAKGYLYQLLNEGL